MIRFMKIIGQVELKTQGIWILQTMSPPILLPCSVIYCESHVNCGALSMLFVLFNYEVVGGELFELIATTTKTIDRLSRPKFILWASHFSIQVCFEELAPSIPMHMCTKTMQIKIQNLRENMRKMEKDRFYIASSFIEINIFFHSETFDLSVHNC